MRSLEATENNFFPPFDIDREDLYKYVRPDVEIEATSELIDKIPEGEWSIPEAYKSRYTERDWELSWGYQENDFIKAEPSRAKWIKRTDNMILPWVKFIDRVRECEEFFEKNRILLKQGKGFIVNGDTKIFEMHEDYRSVTSPKVKMDQIPSHLNSLHRAFVSLLSLTARKKLGIERVPEIRSEDTNNVRHLVNMFNQKYGGLPYGYERLVDFEEDTTLQE